MRLWVKVVLFLSSYLPLFLILTIKNWYNLYITLIFIIVCAYSLLVWVFIMSKKGTVESYKVLKAENKTQERISINF